MWRKTNVIVTFYCMRIHSCSQWGCRRTKTEEDSEAKYVRYKNAAKNEIDRILRLSIPAISLFAVRNGITPTTLQLNCRRSIVHILMGNLIRGTLKPLAARRTKEIQE
jgi:hypothetical protein